MWIRAESGVVDLRRQHQRGTAAPTTYQLRGQELAFFLRVAVRPEESIERADAGLILAQSRVGAVPAEDVRLWHRQRDAGFARIPEDELAGFDRPTLARQRLDTAALDRRLIDAVLVTQRIEIAGLRAEVLRVQ